MPLQTFHITGYDDAGNVYGPIEYHGRDLTISSWGIENGNPSKGLPTGLGNGEGNWRLVISALDDQLEVHAFANNRHTDGPLASLHWTAESFDRSPGWPPGALYVRLDWSLSRQVSSFFVRIFNRTDTPRDLELSMIWAGAYGYLTLAPYSAVALTEKELIELMDAQWVFDSSVGGRPVIPGLAIRPLGEAAVHDIGAMVLAVNRNGTLTNLSGPPVALRPGEPPPRESSGEFNITLDFMEGLHDDWKAAARYAANRIEQIVVADYPTSTVNSLCGTAVPHGLREVDDLLIRIEWVDPGPTSIAGDARICSDVRTSGFAGRRPNGGIVTIPWANQSLGPGRFFGDGAVYADTVLLHEMLHVLGIGSGDVWHESGHVHLNTDRPSFTGPNAVEQFRITHPVQYRSAVRFGFPGVPLNSDGVHWSDEGIDTPDGRDGTFHVFGDIMNIGGASKITGVSVGTLHDLGYGVDYSMADEWGY